MKKMIIKHVRVLKIGLVVLFFAAMTFNVAMTTIFSNGSTSGISLRSLEALAMGYGEGGGYCGYDIDCPGTQICNGLKCVGGGDCNADSDCSYGQVCRYGVCEAGGFCVYDNNCDYDQYCYQGQCLPIGFECAGDYDCPPQEVCRSTNAGNQCVPY
jgi:hypothetical protein